jgi:hypothetical protein
LGPFGRIVFLGEVFKLCQIRTKYKKKYQEIPPSKQAAVLEENRKIDS